MTVCNAIISVGNNIVAAVSKGESQGGDALKKSIEALQKSLVPHWSEDSDKKAKIARQKLMAEVQRGPLKIKVLSKDKKPKLKRRS